MLLYQVTNADFDTSSYLQFAEGDYLTREGMQWFWDAYTTDPAQRAEKYASPLQASLDDLKGLPTTPGHTDEADVLREEGDWSVQLLEHVPSHLGQVAGVGVAVTGRRGQYVDVPTQTRRHPGAGGWLTCLRPHRHRSTTVEVASFPSHQICVSRPVNRG